ncbi:DNA helicase B [Echinops telfairi]|uniref:DNA helicase B n=1 Tax=Echinops telfairi TaxID=9371 RepID=A0AC55CZC8_ECHTE|nr:DNA helicase B [Echinops telfairi]
MALPSQCLRELRGLLYPLKDPVEDDNDCLHGGAEEDEDPVFVDAEELCSGGIKAGCLPGPLRVVICDETTGEKCEVFGRFPLVGPWWRVKVRVTPVGKRYHTQGSPSYFLQTDMSPPNQKHICSLFLQECQAPSEFTTHFLKWVQEVSSYQDLNFETIRETLRTFHKESERKHKKKAAQNEQEEPVSDSETSLPLESTIPFTNAMQALQFPRVMEFLPVLLPRHFNQLVNTDSTMLLEKIEEILSACPWKLGFSKVTYRELRLLQCEASWAAFCQCSALLQLMTALEKNALVIYSKLKEICREFGHTYIEELDLRSELPSQISCDAVWQSLKFLKDIGVVTYEKGCVFPYNLYQAERGIASSISHLMMRPPWRLHVDVRKVLASLAVPKPENSESGDGLNDSQLDEARLEKTLHIGDTGDNCDRDGGDSELAAEVHEVQLDQDQVIALEMICANAVTVISGKGGCGKTTIVSRLFKYVEQLEEEEVKQACEDFEQDQGGSEEWLTLTEHSQVEGGKAIEVLLTAPTGKAAGLLRQRTGLQAYTLCQVNYSFYLWEKNKTTKNIPWKFSSIRVLVVDEGSLVSVGIFKSVLNLLCEHSKLAKLIILGDIRQLPSIEPGNLLKDLFETLKSRKCAVELKTNHRAESQLIVDNATRYDGTSLYSVVGTLLQEKDLKTDRTSQFIAFRRQDCDVINHCCCKHYTGHMIKDHQNRLVFGVGDKICCTRNAYLSDLLPENASEDRSPSEDLGGTSRDFAKNKKGNFESDIRLCNGEIFFITEDKTDLTIGKRRYLTINNYAGLEVTVDFRKLMQFCRIRHSWARTIHTFQGSEEQTVVYVVGKAGRQHWQHVYTAVTRGRSRVYVIAEESQLRRAIRRNSVPRKTRLKHFLQSNLLAMSRASPTQSPSQPSSSGEGGGACTPLTASPHPADGAAPSRASMSSDCVFAFADGWRSPSWQEMDTDESPSKAHGFKRTCAVHVDESPSKVRMVGQPSPQVSSRLQNMRLNNLTPRQLFSSAKNQET